MINNITINFLFVLNFTSIENIKRKCNPIVDLSKFTPNKNILNRVVGNDYNQTLSVNCSQ